MASPYMYGTVPYGAGYGLQTMPTAGGTPVTVQNQNYPQTVTQPPPPTQPTQPPRQAAPPPRPVINESDVKALKEMFPSVEEQVIRGVLENSNGDKDQAADMLLQMS